MKSRRNNHLYRDEKSTLKNLIHEFKDIFRVKLGNDPPVDVEPLYIEFEGTTPNQSASAHILPGATFIL